MNVFDRHVIRRLMTGFAFLTVALIIFFILLHYLEYVDDFMDRGASMREIFLVYYPSYVPEIVRLTSPLALFLACVYLTGRLAQELQLTALQTSGVSLYRLMRPYVLVGLLLTAANFLFNGWVVPRTNERVAAFDSKYLKDAPQQLDISDIHRQDRPGSIVAVGFYDRQSDTAHRVSLQLFDDRSRLVARVDAQQMAWVDSLGRWRLQDAVVRRFPPEGAEERTHFPTLDTLLHVYPRDLARTEDDVQTMTIPAAAEFVASLRRSGASRMGQTLVGYYTKFSYPVANLILVLIAVPLAAVRRRGGQAVQIGLGLFTAFAYLALQKLSEPFGYSGDLSPLLVAWLPHAVFFALALVFLARARK